jgi:hypothetical protein
MTRGAQPVELICQLCGWRSGQHMPRTAGILLHIHALRDHPEDGR